MGTPGLLETVLGFKACSTPLYLLCRGSKLKKHENENKEGKILFVFSVFEKEYSFLFSKNDDLNLYLF